MFLKSSLVLLVMAVGAARANAALLLGPTPYLEFADSPFSGVTGFNYFHLENFEDGLLNVLGVTATGIAGGSPTVLAPSSATDSVDADDGVIDRSGVAGHSLFAAFPSIGISFTFDGNVLGALPTHVGIVWTDGGAPTSEHDFFRGL